MCKHKTGYHKHSCHFCIYSYKSVEGEWEECPCCGLLPKVWVYDNGRQTACGCWRNQYDHFSIYAESIMSVYTRNEGNLSEYGTDDLRKNWNHWCQTGEILFDPYKDPEDGRW